MRYIIIILITIGCFIHCNYYPAPPANLTLTEEKAFARTFYIKVHMPPVSRIALNYVDSNYRDVTLEFSNSKPSESIVIQSVTTTMPTEFTYFTSNNVTDRPFLTVNNNDTLELSYSDRNLSHTGHDALNMVFTKVFDKIIYNDTANTNIESDYNNKRKLLTQLSSDYNLDTASSRVVEKYMAIYFLSKKLEMIEKYPGNKKEFLDSISKGTNEFAGLATSHLKNLMFHFINNSSGDKNAGDFFTKVIMTDRAILKKRYTDALIFDMLKRDIRTEKQRVEILNSLEDRMIDTKEEFVYENLTIDVKVLDAPLQDVHSAEATFSRILEKGDNGIIVLDFWASWCVPCIAELPKLKEIKKKYGNRIQVISASIDDDRGDWIRAVKKYNLMEDSYWIVNGKRNELISFFKIKTIPRYIVLNKDKEVLSSDYYRPSMKEFEYYLMQMAGDESLVR